MKYFLPIITCCLLAGCSNAGESKPADLGAETFRKNCVLCHGADGKLGLSGAKDLSASVLPEPERINIITHGKAVMPAFDKLLSPQEIAAVAHYTLSLNKQLPQ